MEVFEEAMALIAEAGDSKSYAMEAIGLAREGKFPEAAEAIEKAKQALIAAHDQQTDLIRAEIEGKGKEVRLMMVHAQDHLNGALLMRELAEEFIEVYKRLGQK
ncbi:PTS mannose transporter subunit IIA [Clostridia bacterium]|nr:PTS mannose transporter subunit IIA [Clostridia bacterium]